MLHLYEKVTWEHDIEVSFQYEHRLAGNKLIFTASKTRMITRTKALAMTNVVQQWKRHHSAEHAQCYVSNKD